MVVARKAILGVAALLLLLAGLGVAVGISSLWKWAGVSAAVGAAIGIGAFDVSRGFQYTLWIVAAFVAGMLFPENLQQFKEFKWAGLLIVQAVMFGMGTQMKLADFAGILTMPWGVAVGLTCQFTIMPLVGFGLAKAFGFPPEIGAGIILIGSCSSGLASNVMAYLAKANLALSITLTSVATLLAPLMTPLWMKLLAGELVDVKFLSMMATVVKLVVVPVGAALLHDYLRTAGSLGRRVVYTLAVIAGGWLLFLAFGGWDWVSSRVGGDRLTLGVAMPGFAISTFLVGALYHQLTKALPKLEQWMPYASMFGIVYFTMVATAAGQESLLQVGVLLFVASVLHNAAGYLLGYGLSRMARLPVNDARTVAFEVGLQNGGMASGIALAMEKLGTVGIASAIFSPWMNVTGSVLANLWKRRPIKEPLKTANQICR